MRVLAAEKVHSHAEIQGGAPKLRSADTVVDRGMVELAARELLANRGETTFEYKTAGTYHDDARTALFEALTASGHLSRTELSGTLDDIHKRMIAVLCNAYDHALPGFERERRFLELCEELTTQAVETQIAEGMLAPDTQIATFSDIPSAASNDELTSLGYRFKNKKGMTRSRRLVSNHDGTYTRVTEQVSRSNSDGIESEQLLQRQGVSVRLGPMRPDARVLGVQLLHEMSEGVIGIQRLQDAHKGVNIRYGEQAHNAQINYLELRAESRRREQQAEGYISQLALYMQQLDLAERCGKINQAQHHAKLATEVHRILQAICVMRPEYAEVCFGGESVETYAKAADAAATGDASCAASIVDAGSSREETATFCGMSAASKKGESDDKPDTLSQLIQFGIETWPTRVGSCRVPECVSPRLTEVGPCDVCMGQCQPLFDKGWSVGRISRYYRSLKEKSGKLMQKSINFWDLFKSTQPKSSET